MNLYILLIRSSCVESVTNSTPRYICALMYCAPRTGAPALCIFCAHLEEQ